MMTVPTPIFCVSPDPCSCTGGGFELYEPICAAHKTNNPSINNTNATLGKTSTNITNIENEYGSLFDFLGDDTTTVLVSVGVVVLIGVVFALVRLLLGLRTATAEAQRERAEAENANEARAIAEAEVIELREANVKIRKELELSGLNEDQAEIVKNESSQISDLVPSVYKIEWTTVVFEARLGSGSFGDCYRGTRAGRPVAIKKMRAGGFFFVRLLQD